MHCYRQLHETLFFSLFVYLLAGGAIAAESRQERFLPLDGRIAEEGTQVELNWSLASASSTESVTVQRRILGQTGKESWQTVASIKGNAANYRDDKVQPGIAYEYRISRTGRKRVETGYWVAGVDLPAQESRGVALVVVDETLSGALAPRLSRFVLDLTGDGWTVIRHDVPRGDNKNKNKVENLLFARNLRAWIEGHYNSNASAPHALILIGHIPVVKSGQSKPDGHKARPLETDLFYADMDGIWHNDSRGILRPDAIPGDHIEMQVGRIDFSNLDMAFGDEISLLRRYFDKNHHWRHGRLGDLRQAYGSGKRLQGETNALRNIVGPNELTTGGHHDVGRQQPWLFGVDFGSWDFLDYLNTAPVKAVFSLNFGSGKHRFSRKNNTMTAMLAQQWYGLATGWGGRPAWQLHHMALGKSIGYSHMRTVNNGARSKGGVGTLEYTPTGNYTWVNPVWVNLLGDPTIHPFPLPSVRKLQAEMSNGSVRLKWEGADSVAGMKYRVYRALERSGPYQAMNPSALLGEPRFVDPNPVPGAWYMVRAHALKGVYAGSFYTFSQGAFATVDNVLPKAIDQLISTTMGQDVAIKLTAVDSDSDGELTTAFIKDPDVGSLIQKNGGWFFAPDAEFTGHVRIPFTVFDGIASDDGLIDVDVVTP